MSRVTLNGLPFAYDDQGEGNNVLLLVHGHPFNRSMWRAQFDVFGDAGWRVIAPDLRGYGASSVVSGITPLSTFADDLVALLDYLEIGKVVIGGLSMGGQIVMEFCRLFPERVQGIILAATFPQSETAAGKQARSAMADRLLIEGMGPYADEVLSKMLAPRNIKLLPEIANHVLQMMRDTDPQGAAAALRGRAARPSYESTLAALDVPALIVVGDEDAFTSRLDAEQMHVLLKQSELVWLEGVGHMPNLECETHFNSSVAEFLDRLLVKAAHPSD